MKKIFTLIAAAATAMSAMATDYTAPMNIIVDGSPAPQGDATIIFTQGEESYNLTLKNFIFNMGESSIAVGNINVEGLVGTTDPDGWVIIESQQATAKVTKGDDPNVTFWVGPMMMPQVQVNIEAVEKTSYVAEPSLDAYITINVMGQNILVEFGNPSAEYKKFFFNEPMGINMGGTVIPQGNGDLAVRYIDGVYSIELKNFIFSAGETTMPIGNITASSTDVTCSEDGVYTANLTNVIATLTPGDLECVQGWLGGTMLSQLPVNVEAEWTADNMEATITLQMAGIGDIVVYYGQATIDANTSGINDIETVSSFNGIYDLNGVKVANPTPGRVYIYSTNGKTYKAIAK